MNNRINTPIISKGCGLYVSSALALLLQTPAIAQSITWQGGISSDWGDGANWSGGVIPTAVNSTWTFVQQPSSTTSPIITNAGAQASNMFLGSSDGSTLTIKDGGTLTTLSGIVGNSSNGGDPVVLAAESGTAHVQGEGAKWSSSSLTVGLIGNGTVNVTEGAEVAISGSVTLGSTNSASSNGTVAVSGAQSKLSTRALSIGASGTGFLSVTDGATATSFSASLGTNASGKGSAVVSGEGTTWVITDGNLRVGQSGTDSVLSINDGAVVTLDRQVVGIGFNAGSSGKIEVSGAGSRLTSLGLGLAGAGNRYMSIGYSGTGELAVNDGGVVETSMTILGLTGGSGSLNLDGANTLAHSLSYTAIGYGLAGVGSGTATVSNGATLKADGGIRIAYLAGSQGTLNVGAIAGDAAKAAGVVDAAAIEFGAGTGKLVFNHIDTNYVFASALSGNGTIDFLAGETVLTGNSGDFSGTARIDSGNVILRGRLGTFDGQGVPIAAVQINANGMLQVGDRVVNGDLRADITNNGKLVFNQANGPYLFGSKVSGNGTIDVQAGDITFTGDSGAFTGVSNIDAGRVLLTGSLGGTVNIKAEGTLQVGDGVSNGNLTADAVNDGTLIFDQVGNYDYTGALSGSGGLVKRGDGILTLSGDYQYKGSTEVVAGTVRLSSQLDTATDLQLDGGTFDLNDKTQEVAGLSGNGGVLALGSLGSLTVNQLANGSYAGSISGAGTLTKTGAGTLDLVGTSIFSGSVVVDGGRLAVNGVLPGDVSVNQGAFLGGNGTTGAVRIYNAGTLAPGNSIGTLNVNGNVQFDVGSIYEVEVNAAGASDLIEATGAANLLGGTVDVLAEAGDYNPQTTYVILRAANGVQGTFDRATSNLAFLTPNLVYAANTVSLSLTRNNLTFADVAMTPNQRATATAIDAGFASSSALYSALAVTSTDGARQAFDALSGEIHPSSLSVAAQQSEDVRRTVMARFNDGDESSRMWVQGTGLYGQLDGNANTAKGTVRHIGGLRIGAESTVGAVRFGVMGGYNSSDLHVHARGSRADIDSTSATIYAGGRAGNLNLRGGLSYSDLNFKTSRDVRVSNLSERLTSKYSGHATTLFGELGYPLQSDKHAIEPFVGVHALWLKNDAFSEQGGDVALQAQSQTRNRSWSTLGIKTSFTIGDVTPITVSMKGGWQHALGKHEADTTLSFVQGGPNFVVQGAPLTENAALLDLDLNWKLSPTMGLGIGYSGTLANQGNVHIAKVMLSAQF